MLVIRLQRTGRKNSPAYRIVVAEKKQAVQGKFHEIVGHYLPARKPEVLECSEDRIAYWISVGAQPTDTVARLLMNQGMKNMDGFTKRYVKKRPKKEPPPEAAPAAPQVAAQAPVAAEAEAAAS